MRLEQLYHIVAIAQTGSISQAAERSYISQPALSSSVSKLELELGVPLFKRSNQGVQPTEIGEAVIQKAMEAIDLLEGGCGKTSLLNIIAGYLRPTQGSISINGKRHTKPDSEVGVVVQQPNLFPWLSLARNIEFGLRMKKMPKADRRERVAYFLDLMGLSSSGALLPHQLSGGMKQRAAIARTLATEPEILLLDEPFSALDALTRENMQVHLRAIWRKTGKCLFFITHDVDESLLLASRIIVMHPGPGRIVEDLRNPLAAGGTDRPFDEIRASREYTELRQFLVSRIGSHQG